MLAISSVFNLLYTDGDYNIIFIISPSFIVLVLTSKVHIGNVIYYIRNIARIIKLLAG